MRDRGAERLIAFENLLAIQCSNRAGISCSILSRLSSTSQGHPGPQHQVHFSPPVRFGVSRFSVSFSSSSFGLLLFLLLLQPGHGIVQWDPKSARLDLTNPDQMTA